MRNFILFLIFCCCIFQLWLVSLSIVYISRIYILLSFNLFARKLRMIYKQVVGACVLAWSSNQWLWELRVAFSNLHPIEPPRLSFTNPPPLVLLPIARLGHTQGSMGCQTPHCIPLHHTPRRPQSKRMAHRRGEHHTSQGCTVYYLTVSQPGLNIINNILSKKTIGLSDSKRFFLYIRRVCPVASPTRVVFCSYMLHAHMLIKPCRDD